MENMKQRNIITGVMIFILGVCLIFIGTVSIYCGEHFGIISIIIGIAVIYDAIKIIKYET